MYAIIRTGGKQYCVRKGDIITVERLKYEEGDKVIFDEVLVMGSGTGVADVKFGTPLVEGAKVYGELIENGKGDKITIFKYKAKKQYRKKQGHRQLFSKVEITGIGSDSPKEKVSRPAENEKAQAAPVAEKEEMKKKTPSLKSMRKQELIDFAKENGIAVDEKATNAVLIETIEAALK